MHNIRVDTIIGVLIFGATLLAMCYHVILYFFAKDKLIIQYLYYLIFTLIFLSVRLGFFEAAYGESIVHKIYKIFNEPTQILYFCSYFNFILQSIGIGNAVQKRNFLYKSWVAIMVILICYAVFIFIIKLFNPDAIYEIPFLIIRIFIFVITAVMLYKCYQLRHVTFQRFVLYGCSVYFVLGLISFISNLFYTEDFILYPVEWLMIGSFIDIVFFSVALNYRNKKNWENYNSKLLEDANKIIAIQKEVLDKQSIIENERSRIATDMHDDLGSGLTKIYYLSQIDLNANHASGNLSKIKSTATELIESMSEIIWAMKEENDSLEDLSTFIKIYATDYLETNGILCNISILDQENFAVIKGNHRRNIFLIVKEALHNIVKHSGANVVTIQIEINKSLTISIQDNGKGLDQINSDNIKSGNGLKNMKKRIENLDGKLTIESKNGTFIMFTIPIDKIED